MFGGRWWLRSSSSSVSTNALIINLRPGCHWKASSSSSVVVVVVVVFFTLIE